MPCVARHSLPKIEKLRFHCVRQCRGVCRYRDLVEGRGDHLTAYAPPLRPSGNLNELSSGESGGNMEVLFTNLVTDQGKKRKNQARINIDSIIAQ